MKLTVVIPTYNSMKYVDECLDSVLKQAYEDMEIIVYDNESTDGTYEHLLDRQDDRFSVISIPNVEPNGYREAMDHVFENSKSDYVTFISSDDYIDKDYINRNMEVINSVEETISCLQSGMFWVNTSGELVNQAVHTYDTLEQYKALLLQYCPVHNPTVFYHKSIWPILGECREAHFSNNLQDIGVGDYDMWCGLADRGISVSPINAQLGYFYRWHEEQATWKVHSNPVKYDKIIQDYWRDKWTKN